MTEATGRYKIDATRLAAEIQNSLQDGNTYVAVDKAKKRAVHEAHDYSDFLARVACAKDGLIPVGREEMESLDPVG